MDCSRPLTSPLLRVERTAVYSVISLVPSSSSSSSLEVSARPPYLLWQGKHVRFGTGVEIVMLLLDRSVIIWVGPEQRPRSLSHLVLAMTRAAKEPGVSTKLFSTSPVLSDAAESMALRVSRRTGLVVFLSCALDLEGIDARSLQMNAELEMAEEIEEEEMGESIGQFVEREIIALLSTVA